MGTHIMTSTEKPLFVLALALVLALVLGARGLDYENEYEHDKERYIA